MAISEITPSAIKIDKLLNRIEEGDIKIPAFQRGFVWDQEQIIDLLDSVYHDYPIGSILLWSSQEKLKATRNIGGFVIPDRPDAYPVNYVLDGQQRLSTIYAVFCRSRIQDSNAGQHRIDIGTFDLHFDLETKEFRTSDDLIQGNKSFPLKFLFDVKNFFDQLKKLSDVQQETIQQLHSKFNNYEVPIVTITKRSKDEVGVIFERINSTGTKLTTLDLMVAWTWSEDFHLQEEISDLLDSLDGKGFGDLPEKTILQCLSAIIRKSTATKAILKLEPKEVHENFQRLTESLEKAIDFLATELLATKDFLPHVQQIIPLAFFFSRTNIPTADQAKCLKQWFWKTSFSRRYSAQTDEKMDADIAFFEQILDGDTDGLSKYAYTVTSELLVRQKFTRSNPVVRAFLLLLAQNSPLNLVNGNKIDLGKALSKYNSKEYHHVFPRTYLKKREFPSEKINSLCNYCILPSDSNKKISNQAPSDYFAELVPKERFSQIVTSNLMPLKREIFDRNDFETFLVQRSQRIVEFLDSLLN